MFRSDSTIRFSKERGFSETAYLFCPVCWNTSILATVWEDGTVEEVCSVCERTHRILDAGVDIDD